MCGIGGIISTSPRPFNYTAFCALGVINDARGGDSCGIFIDGKYYYGIKEKRYFADAFKDIDILNNTEMSQIALVHCRKASVGAIDHSTAQPVIIAPNNKVEFVLLHNGTIYNYTDLAKKYIPNVNITGMTDSQVMAQIFYYKGYDALEEYTGSATFVIVDYRKEKPEVLLYHGKSKDFSYSNEETEERPLYILMDQENETLYFSSIYQILETFYRDKLAYVVPYNTICKFDGDCIRSIRKIDRSKCTQKKQYKSTYTGYYSSNYCNSFYSDYIICNSYDNTYKLNDKPVNGRLFLSNFGRVEKQKYANTSECYFFNGVALGNAKAFTFLSSLAIKLKMKPEDFAKKYPILIRFLSIDQLMYDDNLKLWVKAIDWNKIETYTGSYQQLTSTIIKNIDNGIASTTLTYGVNLAPYEVVNNTIKFKKLLKEITNESNT